jgi:plastocyanin
MKRLLVMLAALAAALTAVAATGAATKTVQITKNGFTPSTVTVTAGDTITWHNSTGGHHQVVADNGSFASPILAGGASWSYTATKAGRFTYRDAYATSHRGTLKVDAPPATLSLGTSLPTVIYGSATQLNGQVSNQLSNQPVTLTSQAYGKSAQSLQATTTQSTGTFIFGVTPTIATTYVAHYANSHSAPVTVNVAPRVGFGLKGSLFVAKVTSDIGYGGRYVIVQKHQANGTWYSFKHVYLGDTSRATFKIVVPKGRYVLRLLLPASQAGLGYVASASRLMPIVRK